MLQALKKSFQATKAGEAGFKAAMDGTFLNGNATLAESFKMLEDAIVISGANDEGRKIFQIGVSCEADNSFNKDPKDANKYEQEGQKMQFDAMAMIEYYVKMIGEHPLLTYFEDAFSIYDFAGHREFRKRLSNDFPNVTMSLKYLFSRGGLKRMKAVTDFSDFGQEADLVSR